MPCQRRASLEATPGMAPSKQALLGCSQVCCHVANNLFQKQSRWEMSGFLRQWQEAVPEVWTRCQCSHVMYFSVTLQWHGWTWTDCGAGQSYW